MSALKTGGRRVEFYRYGVMSKVGSWRLAGRRELELRLSDAIVVIGGSRWRELSFDARSPSLWLAARLLRTFDVSVARHERAFGPLKAGGRRVEWYRYGDSNPGPVAENHVS